MAYDIDNIPLNKDSVIEFDLTGTHAFSTVITMSCEAGTVTINTAEYGTVHITDRCGNRVVRSTGRKTGVDGMTTNMIYVDPKSATDDEFDQLRAAEGNLVAQRVYPAGKATNARYFQVIGPLKKVGVPGLTQSDADFNFDSMIDGVVTDDKVSA